MQFQKFNLKKNLGLLDSKKLAFIKTHFYFMLSIDQFAQFLV